MRLVNRISHYSAQNGVSFMKALRDMVEHGDCTADEAQNELVPPGIIEASDVDALREIQEYAEAMDADTDFFEVSINLSPYANHPMGIFAEMYEDDDEVVSEVCPRTQREY